METKLKTISLTDRGDNLSVILCPGHVDLKTFNEAMAEECKGDPVLTELELKHEYFQQRFTPCEKDADGALPFTAWREN